MFFFTKFKIENGFLIKCLQKINNHVWFFFAKLKWKIDFIIIFL